MININLNTLGAEELIVTAETLLNTYENEKRAGVTYSTVQGKDLQQLEKALQRVTPIQRGGEAHQRTKAILANDFSIRETEEKKVKSIYEVMREQNGYGRYNVK